METGHDGERVRELPLFPLDLVLFPLMGMRLHIFEDRYKTMVHQCVRESRPFGILLATKNEDGNLSMSRLGCTARIAQVERLPDGCMNIEIVGEERFRVIDWHEADVYLTGIVVPVHDEALEAAQVARLTEAVSTLLTEFLTLYLARMGGRLPPLEFPDDPLRLSYTASCILPIENPRRQALLECTDTTQRLRAARAVLTEEVERLKRDAPESPPVANTFEPVHRALFERFRCNN